MNHSFKQFSWKHLLIFLLVSGCVTIVRGQSRFHIDLDYHYNLGLSESFMDITLKRDKYHMGGHSLRLSTRYDVSRLWSAGIGIGLDRYTKPDYNTMPVFATVRYKALEKVPDAYVFADMGYAIKSGEFTKGLTGSLGIGYTHMFARHFGLNFQIAYNLKRFNDIPTYIYNVDKGETTYSKENSTRHSLSFGIGVTF